MHSIFYRSQHELVFVFKNGKGNPINRKGAPSKAEKLMQDRFSHEAMRRSFLDAGKEMVTMNDPNGGKIRISKMDALPRTVLNEALKGNMRAFNVERPTLLCPIRARSVR